MNEIQTTSRAEQLIGLSGRCAVVTGANRGIGRGIALELARLGARVVVAARNVEVGQAVVREIADAGGEAVHHPFELEDEACITALMRGAVGSFGKLDILVNNAGVYPATRLLETTAEALEEMHRINVQGLFLCLREAAKLMRETGGGQIVNISSMGSVLPAAPSRFADNASKASVNRLTQDAASGLARDGIRVNAVLPGPIQTVPVDASSDPQAAKIREAILRKIALRRWGVPADIAAAVALLVSPASSFITGQCLLVDGGFTLGRQGADADPSGDGCRLRSDSNDLSEVSPASEILVSHLSFLKRKDAINDRLDRALVHEFGQALKMPRSIMRGISTFMNWKRWDAPDRVC